jgi:hypothetical protein
MEYIYTRRHYLTFLKTYLPCLASYSNIFLSWNNILNILYEQYLLIIKITLFVMELTFQGTVLLRVSYSYILHSHTFAPHNVGLFCFTQLWKQTDIIPENEINWVDLVMETVNIACGLENRFLNITF